MMTDIEIAQSTPLCPIAEIAAKAGIPATAAEPYVIPVQDDIRIAVFL